MVQRFKITSPQELKALERLAILETRQTIGRVARAWEHGRQRNGKTPWDDKMVIEFSTEDRRRRVYITRVSADKTVPFGDFHYNKALQWCRANLMPLNP